MNVKGVFMKETDHWATPKDMYEQYMNMGYFDPCPLHCTEWDGLSIGWGAKAFVNPPYSKCLEWVHKALIESANGCDVIMLLPSRTDTKWFHLLYGRLGVTFHFIRGRLKFGGSKNSAPFPSVVVRINVSQNMETRRVKHHDNV